MSALSGCNGRRDGRLFGSNPNKLRKSEGPGILIAPTTDPEIEDEARWHWS